MHMRNRLLTLVFIGLVAGPVSAAPKNVNKGNPEFSTSVKFSNLSGSTFDSAFNEAIFTDKVHATLGRANISPVSSARGDYHLSFEVDYVYAPGDVEYRFATIRVAARNKANHAVCDTNASFWWGGPSGRNQVQIAVEDGLNSFVKHCLK